MAAESKIIITCLNGGLSLGWGFWRIYLSDVMKDAVLQTRAARNHGVEMKWAKGFPLPVDTSRRYPRRVRRVINKAREHQENHNALLMLGKSCGSDNWITHFDDEPYAFRNYGWTGGVFVDTNAGPKIANRNSETLQVNCTGLDHLVGLYTEDPKWGGYMLGSNKPGLIVENKRVYGYSHHNCCKSDLVLKEVKKAILLADNALST